MAEVGILYDTIRLEEKMLFKEAASADLSAKPINVKDLRLPAKAHQSNISFTSDVYLQRCVSYFRALHVAHALESYGFRVVSSFETISVCGNKFFNTLALVRAGVPTPETVLTFSRDSAMSAISDLGYPAMLKPVMGSWGRLIAPLNEPESASAILESREHMHPIYQVYYLQERVNRPPRDIRALVIGGQLLTAIYRYQPQSDWRTNTARGGRAEPCPKTKELEEISVKAAEAVKGEVVGVDCMESESGLLVHEVNHTVEFKNMVRVTGVNIALEILRYLRSTIKR
ncbi:MAG: lysine biosynthesis protein LysX [Candidatus Bathyarchaeia archaeon]